MNPAIGDALKSLHERALSEKPSTKILFADKRYRAIPFSRDNFHKIKDGCPVQKIAALDGGNAEVAGAPDFSLHIFRFACVVFEGNKRAKEKFACAFDAYCLAQAKAEEGRLIYETEIFPESARGFSPSKKFSFDSMDATLGSGMFRAEISRACTAARRMLEWEFAAYVLGNLSAKDIAVIDGSLQTGLTGEGAHAGQAYDAAKKSGAILCGLSKTTRLFTDAGTPASSAIFSLAAKAGIKSAWDFHPVAEISAETHRADMHFVKLHESSRHAFRFEIFDEQKGAADGALGALAKNSVDPSFLGYPYALVAAHNAAKIRPDEVASGRAVFLSRVAPKIAAGEAATDAHGVLDRT